MNEEIEFCDNTLCKECKGNCCKHMGCHLSPLDIKTDITYDNLKNLLLQGNYSIDWWEGYESEKYGTINGFYIRVRNVNANIIDASWGGMCSLLTENGCSLAFKDRPLGARALEPNEKGCISYYTKEQCAKDWEQYYPILSQLYLDL